MYVLNEYTRKVLLGRTLIVTFGFDDGQEVTKKTIKLKFTEKTQALQFVLSPPQCSGNTESEAEFFSKYKNYISKEDESKWTLNLGKYNFNCAKYK